MGAPGRSNSASPGPVGSLELDERWTGFAFGTRVELRARGEDRARLEQALELAFSEFEELEALTSVWRPDSELVRLNASLSTAGRYRISPVLGELLGAALEFARLSGGAFDPTVGAALARAGYYGEPANGGSVSTEPPVLGFAHLTLDGDWVESDVDGLRLDLGGLAKGAAVDRAIARLRAMDVAAACVSAGGSALRAYGPGPSSGAWSLSIGTEPGGARSGLVDRALAVSGQLSEPFFVNGRLVSHQIDPTTGAPVEHGTLEVSCWAAQALDADLASTALAVLGARAGLEWLHAAGPASPVERVQILELNPLDPGADSAPGRRIIELDRADLIAGPAGPRWPAWPAWPD